MVSYIRKWFEDRRSLGQRVDLERGIPTRAKNENAGLYPPNVTLNFGDKVPQWNLWISATIGVILQAFVVVYYPVLGLSKRDSPIGSVAYPIFAAGTVALLLCSYIVEQSTIEPKWTSKKEFLLMWVQKGQVVNDQQFESFLLVSNKKTKSIITSYPLSVLQMINSSNDVESSAQPEARNEIRKQQRPSIKQNKRAGISHRRADPSKFTEALTILGMLTGLCGFILQFIGLRGMNWSATVIQMGAIIVMTALRALVRRGLANKPFAQPLPMGFELDWLATRLGNKGVMESNKVPKFSGNLLSKRGTRARERKEKTKMKNQFMQNSGV